MPTPSDSFGSPCSAERIRTPLAMRAGWAAGSRTGLAWVLVALAGCASQPAPQPPNLSAVGSAYRQSAAEEASALDATRWKGFGDPALERLIARARAANLDVRVAAQRLREARAGSTAASSRLWPTLAAGGSVSDQRTGLPDVVKQNSPDTRAVRGTLDLGWELDVFGAARAGAEAAEFDALAAEAGVAVAQWQVSTEVARQYIVWQGARAQLQQLTALVQAQQDTERLTRSRQAAGLASRFDVSRAAGEAQALAAQLPALRTRVAVTENLLHVLLGLGPAEALPELDPATPAALPEVPRLAAGQPVDLLRRRPDLRAAEQQLLAEAARLRESQADLLPRFFLSAVLGRQDLRLNRMDLAPVGFHSVALAFTAPIFNAGRLRAAVEGQSARERAATLQYERAVLGALQDVENSLVALQQERERATLLDAAADSRRDGLRHAQALRREGQIDLLQLLDAQRGWIAAELARTDSRTQQALDAVRLVQALGGDWHTGPTPSAAEPPTAMAAAAPTTPSTR